MNDPNGHPLSRKTSAVPSDAVEAARADYERAMAGGLGRLTQATDAFESALDVAYPIIRAAVVEEVMAAIEAWPLAQRHVRREFGA